MPFLIVDTNSHIDNMQNFLVEATNLLANELNKPKNYIVVEYNFNKNMIFGGDIKNHGVLVQLKSVGFADKASLVAKLNKFIVEKIGVDAAFVNIEMIDMPASTLAIAGNLLG